MGQKIEFGGTICYGDTYLQFFCVFSKFSDFLATLHDAAGAVREHRGEAAGYC